MSYDLQAKLQQQLDAATEAAKTAEQEAASSKEAAERAQAEFAAKLEGHTGTSVGVFVG